MAEWREAGRYALGSGDIGVWSAATGGLDDPMLIEELRTKILPRRGINARAEEILITVGAQQSLYLLAELLVDSSVSVAMEEPGYPEMRHLVQRRGAPIVHQPIDGDGMLVDGALDGCRIVYVTPEPPGGDGRDDVARPSPGAAREGGAARHAGRSRTTSTARATTRAIRTRRCAAWTARTASSTCRACPRSSRPGLRLGFMVAAPELIAEARKLRRLMVGQPPRNNQRAMAHFIRLGHYDALTANLHETFGRRWEALRDALNFYLPPWVALAPSHGGTVIWVQGSTDLDVSRLVAEAARRGVLVEPVDHFYALSRRPLNCFRMGVSGITEERIRAGVAMLAAVVREFTEGATEHLDQLRGPATAGRGSADAAAGRVDADAARLRRAARDPLECRSGR